MPSAQDAVTRTLLDLLTAKGLVNVVSARFTGVSQGSTVSMYVENPVSNGETVFIPLSIINTQGLVDVDLTENVTEDTQGDDATINNLTIGEQVESDIIARTGGDYSGGTLHTEDIVPGTAGGGPVGPSGSALGSISGLTINEGNNIFFEMTNRSTSSIRLSLKLITTESADKLVTP